MLKADSDFYSTKELNSFAISDWLSIDPDILDKHPSCKMPNRLVRESYVGLPINLNFPEFPPYKRRIKGSILGFEKVLGDCWLYIKLKSDTWIRISLISDIQFITYLGV